MANSRPSRSSPITLAEKNAKTLQGSAPVSNQVKDVVSARAYLEKKGYCTKDQNIHVTLLATIALQLSLEKFDAQDAHNALRALSFLLGVQAENELAERIAEAVLQKVDEGIRQMPAVEALEAAARECGGAATQAKDAFEDFKEDCQDLSRKLSDAAEEVTQAIPTTTDRAHSTDPNQRPTGLGHQQTSYAKVLAQTWTPPSRNMTPPRANNLQILLDQAPGVDSNGLQDLTEKELVAKANMAVVLLANEMEGVPEGVEFLSAIKLQHGGILFKLGTEEGAEWVRRDGKDGFLAKMGGTSVVKERAATVVVPYVPVTFEPEMDGALREVERNSHLKEGSIVKATYIKPKHRRAHGQKVAHAMITFRSLEEANRALRFGMLIEGKQVWGRKKLPQPTRCYKCQAIGVTHMAFECQADHDTCGRCGGNHRATECTATDQTKFKCANCTQTGHGPGDRDCPTMKRAVLELIKRNPVSQLPYFPTSNPETWEQEEQHADIYNDSQNATWVNEDGTYGGGWNEIQGGKARKGTGRLAGGKAGAGGGTTYQVGARGPDRGYQKAGGGRGATRWTGDGMRQTELDMNTLQLPGAENQSSTANGEAESTPNHV